MKIKFQNIFSKGLLVVVARRVGFVDEIDKKDADSLTKHYLGGFKYTYNVKESVEGNQNTSIKGSGTLRATNMSHTVSLYQITSLKTKDL